MNQTTKRPGCLTFLILFSAGVLCLFIGFVVTSPPTRSILSIWGAVLLCYNTFLIKRENAFDLQESLLQPENTILYRSLSEKKLTKLLLAKELQQQHYGEKLRCKAALLRKALILAVALPLFALFLFGLYYQSICIPLLSLTTTVAIWQWNRATPEQVLYAKAKKRKSVPFTQLVKDNLYDEAASHGARRLGIVGIGAFVLMFALFFYSTSQTRIDYTSTDRGIMVTSYRPALTELKKVHIPDTIDGQPVVAIDDNVFKDFAYLKQVTLPDTVNYIGAKAFKNCRYLKEITLPQNLTALGGEAFKNCIALTGIQIPQGVTELRGNTFQNCKKLKDVQLHHGITAIHAYCFRGCESLEEIQLPLHITEIRTYTFEGCSSLKSINIPVGVTRIASHAFHNCTALSDVYLPDTLQEIGSSAFRNCTSLQSVGMPKGVSMEDNAFKESPTKIGQKKYNDQQWERILQEFENKEHDGPLYYVYDTDKGPDAISRYGDAEYVVLADSTEYKLHMEEGQAFLTLADEAALVAFLEKAHEAGVSQVCFCLYTKVGTEIKGSPEFVYSYSDVDTLLAQLKEENEHG